MPEPLTSQPNSPQTPPGDVDDLIFYTEPPSVSQR